MATGAIVARILTQYSDKGSKAAQKDIAKLGKNFDAFASKAGKAFALAGVAVAAFAVKVGVDAVRGAMEDEKQQIALATALRNVTGATDEAIAATVRYLDKKELLVGVDNNQLIPSLQILTQATKDVTQAQQLQNLALDISAGTQKDLGAVSLALAKALGGNVGALTRLGVPLDAAAVKSKDLNAILASLGKTFEGQAAKRAETFEYRMIRLQLAFNQVLDQLGYALIPVLQDFADNLLKNVIPAVQKWIDQNKEGLVKGLQDAANFAKTLIERAIAFGQWVTDNTGKVKAMGILIGTMFAVGAAAKFVLAIEAIVAAMVVLRATAIGTAIATAFATGGISLATAATGLAAIGVTALVTKNFMNSMTGSAEEATKATGKLNSSHASSLKLNKEFVITNNKYNFTLDKTIDTTKKLTAEQKKALEVQAKLAKYGVTTEENDPIQLEAARLNLIKQQAIGIEAVGNGMWDLLEAQFKNNTEAQRYADILAVINDNKISTLEVDALASKWGKSSAFVLDYIAKVTGIKSIVVDKDFGTDAANGWAKAKDKLTEYLALLGAGTISPEVQAVITETDTATAEALAAADAAAKASEEIDRFLAGLNLPETGAGAKSGAISGFTPSTQYGSSTLQPGSPGFIGPTAINVTVNAGNVIGDKEALVDTVRQGILASQLSGKIIQLEALGI